MADRHNWWHWLADVLTPGTDAAASERESTKLDTAERNNDQQQRKLAEIERDTEALRRMMRAETELMHRQWS